MNRLSFMNITAKQKLVLQAIENRPEAADDDAILLSECWKIEGWDDRYSLEHNLKNVSRPESLTRRRRELFNMGFIEYSGKASSRRMTAYANERDMHSNKITNPEITRQSGDVPDGYIILEEE